MPAIEAIESYAAHDRGMVTAMVERSSQKEWAARPIAQRLATLKRARHIFAECVIDLCDAISPELARNAADTRVAEILPLLAACRFLERDATRILVPRKLGRRGLPFWLAGVASEVHRAPMGHVLVIAPSNYPLFLPGVQVLQALAAGNSVTWKPGRGGGAVALVFATMLREAGLPAGLLAVTDASVEAAQRMISDGVDKVFFTGSAASGRTLLKQLAETLTPCVAELSGCDAVFVLPSADLSRVIKALAFGMRLNGSATCMAPRRVILVGADEQRRKSFIGMLLTAFDWIKGVPLAEGVRRDLQLLIDDASLFGGHIHGGVEAEQQPVVISDATPEMRVTQADIFAPVLALMDARDALEAVALHEACTYALTASIFGDEEEARQIASEITVGTVTINDLIVPTADPRMPFGGRKGSGFGATRGAEGLLEMTAAKVISVRRGKSTRHFDAATVNHEELFDGVIAAFHRASWRERMLGVRQILTAAQKFGTKK
jgi:acyl-CoA reductase-like NAD-dependent aldehyde dehydrogenase